MEDNTKKKKKTGLKIADLMQHLSIYFASAKQKSKKFSKTKNLLTDLNALTSLQVTTLQKKHELETKLNGKVNLIP